MVELNEWVTDAQHWFSTHACSAMLTKIKIAGECTAFVWPAQTRYCAFLLKFKRFLSMKALLRRVVASGVYREKRFRDDPFPEKIDGADVWDLLKRVCDCMGPILLLCRLADSQKPVISKCYGTQLYVRQQLRNSATRAGPDSLEQKVFDAFMARWPDMQNDILASTYMLDPLFVDKSKTSAECTIKLWALARKLHVMDSEQVDEDAWTRAHGILVEQLALFQAKGGTLVHMSSEAAWCDLHTKCALKWWTQWGQETPELTTLALKLVPLMIGSGPAERTWKDVGNILTKKRNRLGVQRCLDLVHVRT